MCEDLKGIYAFVLNARELHTCAGKSEYLKYMSEEEMK